MPDLISNYACDNFRLARSKRMVGTSAAGTYSLIRLPKFAFVESVWVYVDTVCSATDISVGWIGNGTTAVAAGFMSSDVLKAGVVGMKKAVADTLITSPTKWFNGGSGMVTVTIGTTLTTGGLIVFVKYGVIR